MFYIDRCIVSMFYNDRCIVFMFYIDRCIVFMLRQALSEDLTSQSSVLQYIGSKFRIKLPLPEWYSDEEVGQFLIR